MKKLLILGVMLVLTSCGNNRQESVDYLRSRYPNDSIMSTGDKEFYVVDSMSIRKITFSPFNAKRINDIKVLVNQDHQ